MAGYMILYLCIVKALLISVGQPACIGSKCLDEVDGDGPCTRDGLCDDKEVDLEKRQKREAQYAYYVEFQIRLSESLVSVLKSEQILLRLEEYLQNSTGVNPQDIFNLTMFSNPDEKLLSRYIVSFILQPETRDVNWILKRIETLVNLETGIQLIGMPVYMHPNTFVNSTTLWDGINTIIRFKLMVEYEWLEHNGLADSNNFIATFLHERFQIALRDMYDLTLMDTTEDIFKSGFWQELDEHFAANNTLKYLANLMPDYVLKSKSENTKEKYIGNFNKWRSWCRSSGISNIYPGNEFDISLFLTALIQNESSYSVIEGVFYSLKWANDLANVKNPCDSKIVNFLLVTAKRVCNSPVIKKKPFTTDMITKLIQLNPPSTANLYDLRSMTIIVLGFTGFLRISEIVNLKCNDVTFCDTYFELKIRNSKTDQGQTVLIARTHNSTCPYHLLIKFPFKRKACLGYEIYFFKLHFDKEQ